MNNDSKKIIGIVTSTRADWGLLKPLAQRFQAEPTVITRIYATGTHFLEAYGSTYQTILADGFEIAERIDAQLYPNSAASISKSFSLTTIGFADVFARNRPDLLIVLGDRYEILAVTIAAANARIPIAHLHGGETTEGALDESYRHAITKFASLHFASCETYRKRIIQLGENPDSVFNVGAIGIDNILRLPYATLPELSEFLKLDLSDQPYCVVTFHPETKVPVENAYAQLETVLKAIEAFPHIHWLFTLSNADLGGAHFNNRIRSFCAAAENRLAVDSLGNYRYLGAVRHADFVLGNSSSGIIEVPYFRIPTINIGDRQRGRLSPASVINCDVSVEGISAAILQANKPAFRESLLTMKQIYGDGHATEKIAEVILEKLTTNGALPLVKPFYNLQEGASF